MRKWKRKWKRKWSEMKINMKRRMKVMRKRETDSKIMWIKIRKGEIVEMYERKRNIMRILRKKEVWSFRHGCGKSRDVG